MKKKFKIGIFVVLGCLNPSVYALGLGDLEINSLLNQPFNAEIALVGTGTTPLSGIKVKLASLAEFERIGMDKPYVLSALKFEVVRNHRGKAVVRVTSQRRIDEPFLQILLDLAWADGQLYRAYTVLLDPPGYRAPAPKKKSLHAKIKKSLIQGSPILGKAEDKPFLEEMTSTVSPVYGPTQFNDNIKQIARRYQPLNANLSQTMLAILASNSSAFAKGNVFGLLPGNTLYIPGAAEVSSIPPVLAHQEIKAQSLAWQKKLPVQHVLVPPKYKEKKKPTPQTSLESNVTLLPQQKPVQETSLSTLANMSEVLNIFDEKGANLKNNTLTQANVTSQQLVSLKQGVDESRQRVSRELSALQQKNKLLEKTIKNQQIEIKNLQSAITALKMSLENKSIQAGLAGQASTTELKETTRSWWLFLSAGIAILMMVGFGSMYYRQRKPRNSKDAEEPIEENIDTGTEMTSSMVDVRHDAVEEILIVEQDVKPTQRQDDEDNSIEFVLKPEKDLIKENKQVRQKSEQSVMQSSSPFKSSQALDTLLSLAQTYISMEDWQAARQSLLEVVEYGSASQQEKARTLLSQIPNQ